MNIYKVKSKEIETNLVEKIIEFDKENMKEVLERASLPFDEERRRLNFANDDTLIIIEEDTGEIIAYLEYGVKENSLDSYYIVSLQIRDNYRNSFIIMANLLFKAKKDLEINGFKKITCNVHIKNKTAVELYKRLGFEICTIPNNDKLLYVYADNSIFESKLVKLLEKHFNKTYQ